MRGPDYTPVPRVSMVPVGRSNQTSWEGDGQAIRVNLDTALLEWD